MVEELIEKLSLNTKKYIGALMGFAFGYVFIAYGFLPMLVVMFTTFIGWSLGDKGNTKKIKKIIIDRLKEE